MEKYKSEMVIHTMDGSTTTTRTILNKNEVAQALFGTTGFNSLVAFCCDNDQSIVLNMNNVCFISINELGDEDGSKGSN